MGRMSPYASRNNDGERSLCNDKLDQHRSHDLNRPVVEYIRFVLPPLHCFYSGRHQQGVPTDGLNFGYISVLIHNDTEQDHTSYALFLRIRRIVWVDFCNQKMPHYAASNPYTAMDSAPRSCSVVRQASGSVPNHANWITP